MFLLVGLSHTMEDRMKTTGGKLVQERSEAMKDYTGSINIQ